VAAGVAAALYICTEDITETPFQNPRSYVDILLICKVSSFWKERLRVLIDRPSKIIPREFISAWLHAKCFESWSS